MNEMINNKCSSLRRLAGELERLKSQISIIIDEGLNSGLDSERIVEDILTNAVVDTELVLEQAGSAERPITISEILLIARKAVEQASFDGAFVALPSGGRIRKRCNELSGLS